jgi:hypothetical protein
MRASTAASRRGDTGPLLGGLAFCVLRVAVVQLRSVVAGVVLAAEIILLRPPSSINMFRRPATLEHPKTQRVGDRAAQERHSQREEAVRMRSGLPLQVKKCTHFCAIRFAANRVSKRPHHAQSPRRHAVTQASPVPSL